MRRNWLSSHLGAGAPWTSDSLERCNLHAKENFTENLLHLMNRFVNAFRAWASKESRRLANLYADSPLKRAPDKISAKVITRIRYA